MLFLPYNTDAPIYYLPIATGVIIVANIAIFCVTTLQVMLGNVDVESIDWLILQFNTINPIQWLSGAFMHGDPMHLLSNMFFLWAFGVVVEGKIGSLKFALLYFLIALIDGAMVQLPMFILGDEGGALGASGVIFALMMIAVIWAPENEIDCFYWFFYLVGTAEIRIVKLGVTFVFIQIVFLGLGGFSMSSEMLHMIGAFIGAPIGFYMLRQDMVDCEGWDVVSRNDWLQEYDLLCSEKQRRRIRRNEDTHQDPVAAALTHHHTQAADRSAELSRLKGSQSATKASPLGKLGGLTRKSPAASTATAPCGTATTPAADVSAHPEFNRLAFAFRQAVEGQSAITAEQTFLRMDQQGIASGLSDQMLLRFVAVLAAQKKWLESLRPLQIVGERGGPSSDDARIKIAQIQLKVMQHPKLAVQTLNTLRPPSDPPTDAEIKRQQIKAQLIAAAKQMIQTMR